MVRTRAEAVGLTLHVGDPADADLEGLDLCGILLQYPTTEGRLIDPAPVIARAKAAGATVVMAADLLALTLVASPGSLGADIAVGSTQRFGVPLGFGGPHAAYLSTESCHSAARSSSCTAAASSCSSQRRRTTRAGATPGASLPRLLAVHRG